MSIWIFSKSPPGFIPSIVVRIRTWVTTCQLHANCSMQILWVKNSPNYTNTLLWIKNHQLWPEHHTSKTLFKLNPSFSVKNNNKFKKTVFWKIRLIERLCNRTKQWISLSRLFNKKAVQQKCALPWQARLTFIAPDLNITIVLRFRVGAGGRSVKPKHFPTRGFLKRAKRSHLFSYFTLACDSARAICIK